MARKTPTAPDGPHYSIKAVAALTGLPASTLRTWERRYRVVAPERTDAGDRRYSQRDLDRLLLVRALVQAGEAIRDVAGLSAADLRLKADMHDIGQGTDRRLALPSAPRLALLHHALPALVAGDASAEIVLAARTLEEFERTAAPQLAADVLLVELERVEEPTCARLHALARRVGAKVLWVTYHFAPAALLDALADSGATLLRAPVSLPALRRRLRTPGAAAQLRGDPQPGDRDDVPARAFDDLALAKLQQLRPELACECPNHLAALVAQLVAFERYSERCESTSVEDRQLHRRLRAGTARVRAALEVLLREVVEYDGISL